VTKNGDTDFAGVNTTELVAVCGASDDGGGGGFIGIGWAGTTETSEVGVTATEVGGGGGLIGIAFAGTWSRGVLGGGGGGTLCNIDLGVGGSGSQTFTTGICEMVSVDVPDEVAGVRTFGGGGGIGFGHKPRGSSTFAGVTADGVDNGFATTSASRTNACEAVVNEGGTTEGMPILASAGALGGSTQPDELDALPLLAGAAGNKSSKERGFASRSPAYSRDRFFGSWGSTFTTTAL
jgi:hypothetical protein